MADRTKKICALSFKFVVEMEIPFSVCMTHEQEKRKEDFQLALAQKDISMSKQIRKFILDRMGLNTKKDFSDLISKQIKDARTIIYNKMGVSINNQFSAQVLEDMEKYLNEVENEKKRK